MASLKYFSTPGWGEIAKEQYHYSEAVLVGDRLELAGQGGMSPDGSIPPALANEISNAFNGISRVIVHALSTESAPLENGWDKVFRITSYHVNLKETDKDVLELMLAAVKRWCPNHRPIWTLVGVDRLALESMRVEVEVSAYAG